MNIKNWLPLVILSASICAVGHAAEDEGSRREQAFQDIYDALDEDIEEAEQYMGLTRATAGAGPMYLVGGKPLESLDTEALEEVSGKGSVFITMRSIDRQREQRAERARQRDQQDIRNSLRR